MSKNECEVCGRRILVMIFRNTGLCSVRCQKVKLGETPLPDSDPEFGGSLSERMKRASHE